MWNVVDVQLSTSSFLWRGIAAGTAGAPPPGDAARHLQKEKWP
jgi:hypothetical protein